MAPPAAVAEDAQPHIPGITDLTPPSPSAAPPPPGAAAGPAPVPVNPYELDTEPKMFYVGSVE